jgi:hypothetical protein
LKRIIFLAALVGAAFVALSATAFAGGVTSTALAAKPFTQATGDIYMSGPSQQATFDVFDYGATGDRGSVTYTNFDYPGGLSYTAAVICANVDSAGHTAWFTFQIPNGFPGLSGLYVEATTTDGGSPGAGHDTWGHTATSSATEAQTWCDSKGGGTTDYPIVAGNLVVH